MGRFLLILIVGLFSLQSIAVPAGQVTDSIRLLLQNTNESPQRRVELLLLAASSHHHIEQSEAKTMALEALELASELGNQSLCARSNECLANIYSEMQQNDSAIVHYEQAIHFYTILNEEQQIAQLQNKIGLSYESLGDYPQAFRMYLESLKGFEKLKDYNGIAREYLNIGLINQYRRNFSLADFYFQKALVISRQFHYESLEASALNNLGINCQQLKNLPLALNYFKRVLEMDRRSGNLSDVSYSLNNVGSIYYDQKEYHQALKFFLESAEIKDKLSDFASLVNTQNNIGNTYLDMGKFSEATTWFKKAEVIALRFNLQLALKDIYFSKYKLAKKTGHFSEALYLYEKHSEIEDSLDIHQKDLALEQIQKQYDVSQYADDLEKKTGQLEQQRKLTYLYIGLAGLLLILAIISVFIIFRFRTLNRKLNLHQLEIQRQNENLRQKNLDIAKAKQHAEDAAKSKGQFLSVMSHEIRTPLNAIIGVTNLLHNADLGGDNNRLATILKTSSDNLMALINDLLDISKIESGKLHLEYVDFDLKSVITNLHDLFLVKAREKGLDLKLEFDSKLNQKLLGDPLRINQILSNLIGNGIKFTEKGNVTIIVKQSNEGKDYNDIYFEIRDTGIGIPIDKQQTIFESFEQADKKTTRIYGGTGLGLSISKQLLEMLGSELSLSSIFGKGSSFFFTIRFNKTHPEGGEELQNEVAITELLKGKRILIAEDNPVNVYILKQLLAKWNMQVKVADDGLKSVDMALNYNFDVILMDINMPLLDGYDAARRILQVKPGIPIIAITATTLSETTDLMKTAGIVDYVPKPFQPNELVEKIVKNLSAKGSV